jgi:hypothetical protein
MIKELIAELLDPNAVTGMTIEDARGVDFLRMDCKDGAVKRLCMHDALGNWIFNVCALNRQKSRPIFFRLVIAQMINRRNSVAEEVRVQFNSA